MITGDNGLIEKAGKAKNNTEESQVYEEVSTAVLIVANSNKTFNEKIDALSSKLGGKTITDEGNNNEVTFEYKNYKFTANLEDGDIELLEGE